MDFQSVFVLDIDQIHAVFIPRHSYAARMRCPDEMQRNQRPHRNGYSDHALNLSDSIGGVKRRASRSDESKT